MQVRDTGRDSASQRLTIVLADDDLGHRRGVREALKKENFSVLAEADDAASAIALTLKFRPDICLIDHELPQDGLHAIGRIAKSSPATLVVVLSSSGEQEDVVDAFQRGASGFLLKGISGERLASTLRAAYNGEPALSRVLVPYLVAQLRRGSERQLVLPQGPVQLTPRESEVGDLLCDGHSTAEIATRLDVSPVTVRRHVGLLVQKLGAESREDAVRLLRTYARK